MQIRIVCSLLFVAALSACKPAAPAAPAPEVAAPPTPAAPAAPAPVPAPVAELVPAEFVVSTNEPFWQARVAGDSLHLSGPAGTRTLAVQSNESVADGRRLVARDAQGTLEVKVIAKACQDDMSGADFPFSGSLSFDGGVEASGCARGADQPAPKPAD